MIIVAGGTGRLGSRVANRLARRGLAVRALSRGTVSAHPLDAGIETVTGDVRDARAIEAAVRGATTVVSAVQGFVGAGGVTPSAVDRDGNAHLVDAAERGGCEVVLVSVLRAAPNGPMELTRMKYAAEQRLVAGTCPWTVVRPEAFAQTWIEILQQTAGRSRRPLVFGDGVNPIGWVDVEDVAALVERAVVDTTLRGRVLEIAGPESLGLLDLARAVMAHEGWPGSPRRVPRGALRLAAATVGRVRPATGRQVRAALAMDTLRPVDTAAMAAELPDLPRTAVSTVIGQTPRSTVS
jgi:NADH dehydrogenase